MQRSTIPGSTRSVSTTYSRVAIMFAALGLAACGGGGGGSDAPPATPPATPPPSAPANTAPTVEAGAAQTIQLPTNTVDLQGSATDAEGSALTYTWTASPAAGVTFDNAAAAATRVTFTDAGTYTLTLSASDGSAAGTDTVEIIVSAADAPPPPPPTGEVWPGADSETDPNHGWIAATPAEVGMDSARLAEAETYAKSGGGGGMITRHGKLVLQWSDPLDPANPADDINIDQRVDLKSTTKSIGGIALGFALDEGVVRLADLAKDHLPAIADPALDEVAARNTITIGQLATHTAGFDKAAAQPPLSYGPPGTQWFYSDGGLNWLADVLTTKYNRDLTALLTERVFTPLQITTDDLVWRAGTTDANGLQFRDIASGITANANAMARIGLLFLRKGMWNGQRIISESFVQTASTPRPETASAVPVDPTNFPTANEGYGLLWWTNAKQQLPDVPADAYWAWGLGDSLIVVIPSLDIVIARVGTNPDGNGPHWRYSGAPMLSRALWNGDYEVLRPFLTPIAQSVTTP